MTGTTVMHNKVIPDGPKAEYRCEVTNMTNKTRYLHLDNFLLSHLITKYRVNFTQNLFCWLWLKLAQTEIQKVARWLKLRPYFPIHTHQFGLVLPGHLI